ncbi:pseudouridine synthase [Ottowia testudinis]|uniref:tRNA pseudouridine synthase C n=1 Tax=Ottowia testudinis TaxID=2816950 RepID=A0A975CHQ7_9BURK|nr:pseudouridine synthase [Ottowia testudinis]QTD46580.1 pseudouridine synthase [Ottowia testudinis]
MLPILYQDAHLIAIDKPAGLLVHRSGLDAHETRFAVQLLRGQIGRPVWPAHRLDKGTSGVLLFALDAATASALGQAFETPGAIAKTYRAVVRGWPPANGVIDHPLTRLPDDARAAMGAAVAQPARTHFRVLEKLTLPLPYGDFAETRCAVLELQPETGRRHQLRRHCKHMAHPIIGDATHGKGPLNRALADWLGVQRLWLHAESLGLTHPWSGQLLRIGAVPASEWRYWRRARTQAAVSRPASTNSYSSMLKAGGT